ncbi:hypothetical protein DIURU_003537 [Diutina rugosa]|uniref:PI31 proteasome regulator C-terminal domain-containing protein n=1 Tax=Diutina rugosa TaxID=5481 RepID=A0A642ULD8_DIURU|nr:uncharacterized protein DIURU_003537 [Diutina rugosa]KAA8901167.1 hypothetical protein DIURU_003537 [Diutina rugosa]
MSPSLFESVQSTLKDVGATATTHDASVAKYSLRNLEIVATNTAPSVLVTAIDGDNVKSTQIKPGDDVKQKIEQLLSSHHVDVAGATQSGSGDQRRGNPTPTERQWRPESDLSSRPPQQQSQSQPQPDDDRPRFDDELQMLGAPGMPQPHLSGIPSIGSRDLDPVDPRRFNPLTGGLGGDDDGGMIPSMNHPLFRGGGRHGHPAPPGARYDDPSDPGQHFDQTSGLGGLGGGMGRGFGGGPPGSGGGFAPGGYGNGPNFL